MLEYSYEKIESWLDFGSAGVSDSLILINTLIIFLKHIATPIELFRDLPGSRDPLV